jgi:hypothetical protein
MRLTKTLIHIFIDKLYNCIRSVREKVYGKTKVLQMEAPSICESRQEKDEIILATIEHLERNIKIN